MICDLFEAGQFSVIALVESWLVVLPRWVAAVAAAAKYTLLVLPPLPSTNGHGRNHQGTIVFVHHNLWVSGVSLQCTEWGEYVSFLLDDRCHLVVLYWSHSSSLQSCNALLLLFANIKYDLPSLWIGDFNWSMMLSAVGDTAPFPVMACTKPPPTSPSLVM